MKKVLKDMIITKRTRKMPDIMIAVCLIGLTILIRYLGR